MTVFKQRMTGGLFGDIASIGRTRNFIIYRVNIMDVLFTIFACQKLYLQPFDDTFTFIWSLTKNIYFLCMAF